MSARSKFVLGIDPGFSGALAYLDIDTHELDIYDVPTTESYIVIKSKTRRRRHINVKALAMIVDGYATDTVVAMIEEVGPRPQEGVSSVFRFGYGAGMLAGVIGANHIPAFYSPPAVWKSAMGLTSDKDLSRSVATRHFPQFAHYFLRAKDDGRAESAMLALFGAEKLLKGL